MTALENVMVGRHIRTGSGLLGAMFRTPGFKAEEAAIANAPGVAGLRGHWQVCRLQGPHTQLWRPAPLEIARALATDPQLIALDEPAAGMNATEKGAAARAD
jgi:branched-chain amino acid transport system ATP-binding protein